MEGEELYKKLSLRLFILVPGLLGIIAGILGFLAGVSTGKVVGVLSIGVVALAHYEWRTPVIRLGTDRIDLKLGILSRRRSIPYNDLVAVERRWRRILLRVREGAAERRVAIPVGFFTREEGRRLSEFLEEQSR